METKTVLIVDDDVAHSDNLIDILVDEGYQVFSAETCNNALKIVGDKKPQVALLDLKLPDGSGTELIPKIKKIDNDCICIMITAYADLDSAVAALGDGAFQYLYKPLHPEHLLRILNRAFEVAGLKAEQKNTQQALRESEHKYRTILESIEEGYYEIDLKGAFFFFNDSISKIWGYSKAELLEMNIGSCMDSKRTKEVFDTLNSVKKTGTSKKAYNLELIRKNGSRCFVDISVSLILDTGDRARGFRGIVRDISERKKNEEERKVLDARLAQSQKMEAVGTLAGGIAHDFNNILSAIMGYTELTCLGLPEDNKLKGYMDKVLKASQRAKELISQILTFSRQTEQEMKPVRVDFIIKEVLKLLRATLPATIEIHTELECKQSKIIGCPAQIHQVLMNLGTNASHAMPSSGGKLSVKLEDCVKTGVHPEYPQDLQDGTYIRLTVSDTGKGIPPDIISRIYEPYFTTKEKGKGTGMGLSVVHGIVKNHKGSITVRSEPGAGTTFYLYFPKIDKDIACETVHLTNKTIPTGNERILLIDDETSLIDLGEKTLQQLGYKVTTMSSSIEALQVFNEEPERFDLIITDQTMPKMTGLELAGKFKHIRSDVPIILCSGYSADITPEKIKNVGIWKYLTKPFTNREIAETVRGALDQG